MSNNTPINSDLHIKSKIDDKTLSVKYFVPKFQNLSVQVKDQQINKINSIKSKKSFNLSK